MSTLYPAPLHAPAAALPAVVERDQLWLVTCHAADGVRPSPTAATVPVVGDGNPHLVLGRGADRADRGRLRSRPVRVDAPEDRCSEHLLQTREDRCPRGQGQLDHRVDVDIGGRAAEVADGEKAVCRQPARLGRR